MTFEVAEKLKTKQKTPFSDDIARRAQADCNHVTAGSGFENQVA